MDYPIQRNLKQKESSRSDKTPVDSDTMAAAIAGVIHDARQKGQTLDELKAEVLVDDHLLRWNERRMLSDLVAEAWLRWPEHIE